MRWASLVYGQHVSEFRTYYGSDTRLDGLLFGCAAALIASPILDRSAHQHRSTHVAWARWPAGLAGISVILATLVFRDDGFRETLRYTIQSMAIVACLRYAIVSVGSPVFRVLNIRPIAWFGRMSYSFYLVHQIIISWLHEHMSSKAGVLVITLVLATAVSWALHLLVERPVGRFRARVLRPSTRAPAIASSTSHE